MTTLYRRLARWQRCRKHRPAPTPDALMKATAYGMIIVLALGLLTMSSANAITAMQEQKWEEKYHSLEAAMLICLNGGAPFSSVETLESGQQVTVYVQCAKAKEKLFH